MLTVIEPVTEPDSADREESDPGAMTGGSIWVGTLYV